MTARADVLVVGAGAGGAFAALRLQAAGVAVVCLEQGGWPDRDDYRGNAPDWELTSRKQWSGSPNVRATDADYPIDLADADVGLQNYNGVGGGTVLYAGQWPRLLPADLRARSLDGVADDWPLDYAELQPYYDEVERQIGVSGLGGNPMYPEDSAEPPLPPLPIGKAGLKVARAHARLGWHWWPEPNAILSAPYQGRHVCVQRGTCMQGCNEGAKGSTDLTHWPRFVAAGGTLLTHARVRRVVLDQRGLAAGVEWLDVDGREHFLGADVVLLAANGVGTARILLNSRTRRHPDGLANRSGLVGRRLMVHPYAMAVGYFDEPLESWQGQFGASIQSLQHYRSDPRRGFVRGAKWGLVPTGGPLRAALPPAGNPPLGPEVHRRVRDRLGRSAAWGVLCEDLPDDENQVTLARELVDGSGIAAPAVRYRLGDNSLSMQAWHLDRAAESLVEAGATRVEVDRLMPTGHLLGTARMGHDPDRSVVDPYGFSHDVPNLGIVDGSVFVTAGGVNPTSTIAALALRTADRLLARRQPVEAPPTSRTTSGVAFAAARPAPAPAPAPAVHTLDATARDRLARVADVLVPPTDGMPAPSSVGIGTVLVDEVLRARPDLRAPLLEALEGLAGGTDADALEPAAAAALRLVVVGGYYLAPEVRERIGYPGQLARPVNALDYPDYLAEGLLDHLLDTATS